MMKLVAIAAAAFAALQTGEARELKPLPLAAAAAAGKAPALRATQATLGSIASCGSSTDHAQNLVVSVSPENPVAGENVTLTFEYDLDKEVTGGTATYAVTLNYFPLPSTVDDLCADQEGGDDPCPLAVGHHKDVSVSPFPSGVSGKVVSDIIWKDQDGQQVLCVRWTVKI